MEKIKSNPRFVIAILMAVGVGLLISCTESNKSTDLPIVSEETVTVGQSEDTEQSAPAVDNKTVIGSTPEAGPVKVDSVETESEKTYTAVVRKGDNQTVIARQMLNEFLSDKSSSLTAEQRLYVETVIVDSLPRNDVIYVGTSISVASSVISSAVEASSKLTEAQLARWSAYL